MVDMHTSYTRTTMEPVLDMPLAVFFRPGWGQDVDLSYL